jgi:hypothetical protein
MTDEARRRRLEGLFRQQAGGAPAQPACFGGLPVIGLPGVAGIGEERRLDLAGGVSEMGSEAAQEDERQLGKEHGSGDPPYNPAPALSHLGEE